MISCQRTWFASRRRLSTGTPRHIWTFGKLHAETVCSEINLLTDAGVSRLTVMSFLQEQTHSVCQHVRCFQETMLPHAYAHTHTLTHVTFSENEMSVLNYSSGVSDNSPESDESKRWGIMHEGARDFHLVCLRLFPDAVFWPITLPLKSLRPAWVVSKPIFWNNTQFSLLYLPQREN